MCHCVVKSDRVALSTTQHRRHGVKTSQKPTAFTTYVKPHSGALALYDAVLKTALFSDSAGVMRFHSHPGHQRVTVSIGDGDDDVLFTEQVYRGSLAAWYWHKDEPYLGKMPAYSQRWCSQWGDDTQTVRAILEQWLESDLSRCGHDRYCVMIVMLDGERPLVEIYSEERDDSILEHSCTQGLLRHWYWLGGNLVN
jgi:hypothetical protein